jgi:hypothetical protein
MARYVVLYFEDNEMAERMVEEFTDFNGALTNIVLDNVVLVGEVKALVPAPTQFCEGCTGKNKGYTLGQKYFWWVCIFCKKPSRLWGGSYRAVIGSGRNLLEEEPVRPPPGWDQESGLKTA